MVSKKKKKKEFERVMRVGDGLKRQPQVFSSHLFLFSGEEEDSHSQVTSSWSRS